MVVFKNILYILKFDPQERVERSVFGITPLNVGEDEFIKCYTSKPDKNISYCKTRANAIRKKYSQESLIEIREELRALYSPKDIDIIVDKHHGSLK